MANKARVLVALLTISTTAVGTWFASEGFKPEPYIPTRGDVATVGYGSTKYEDGTPVRMGDAAITRHRAEELARNLFARDELALRTSLHGVTLYQDEYDVYLDFIGQYGVGNWNASSMRRFLLNGDYRKACDALLRFRFQAGRDCSLPVNAGPNGCKGVWTRQQQRHAKCVAAQVAP